jgi:DNA ligase (NAD+)
VSRHGRDTLSADLLQGVVINEGHMVTEVLKKRVDKLREEIEYHDHRYYVLDQPEIPDAEYDRLMRELEKFVKQYRGPRFPNSQTQKVLIT